MTTRISKKEASVEAVLRSGHENDKGEQPVRIRVTYNRKTKYYPVKIDGKPLYLKPNEWQGLHTVKVRGEKKAMKEAFQVAFSSAVNARDKITSNGHQFTFERFEAEYLVQESKKGFLKIFRDHLQELLKEERIGTYKSYQNAFTAFNKFRGAVYEFKGRETIEIKQGRELNPIDITPALLKDFDTYMKKRDASRNTIAFYMRGLKVVYNLCVSRNPGLAEFYPFARKQNDKGKYKIKTGAGKKGEALSVEELQAFIKSETTPGMPEHEAKLLWLFSFYCQGMNLRDIALLKYENIDLHRDVLTYVRKKTKDTEAKEETIEIPLNEVIREIITELGNPDKRKQSYVFGILDKGMSALYQDDVIRQKIKLTNKWLKRLCKTNSLPEITSYWGRHSYASLAKESGESVEMIRELLGHSDIKTTEAYLKRFDIGRKRKVNEGIMKVLKAS